MTTNIFIQLAHGIDTLVSKEINDLQRIVKKRGVNLRKIFQQDAEGEITVLGRTEEHPHFYVGTLLAIDDQYFCIVEIREGDLGKPLYVKPINLNENVYSNITDSLQCPYCDAPISEGLMGYTHDTVVDCDNCSGVSHVQRLGNCKLQVEDSSEIIMDILYIVIPKIAGVVIPIAVTD